MANRYELPVNIVKVNKPKLLAVPGLDQKVSGQVTSLSNGVTLTTTPIGEKVGPKPFVYY
jgi:hypothetical protein